MPDALFRLRVQVEGLGDIQRRIAAMPGVVQRRILRGALRAGGSVLRKYLRREAPVSKERRLDYTGRAPHRSGALRRSVRVGVPFVRAGRVSVRISAGGREAFYAHIVEGGAKAHRIARRAGGRALSIGGRFVAGAVNHPGFRGRFFARLAAAKGEQPAVQAFRAYVDDKVSQYWRTGSV